MTPTRLRDRWPDEILSAMYAEPHDHHIYGRGHGERVQTMIDQGRAVVFSYGPIRSIADLSCGNGFVAKAIARECGPNVSVTLGDFAPGYEYTGPIEETVNLIPHVDLFTCGETIEHLDDPEMVLHLIHKVTDWLVLSTPVDNWEDANAQHYWAWSLEDVAKMLNRAGFAIIQTSTVDSREYGEPYKYGIWTARKIIRSA